MLGSLSGRLVHHCMLAFIAVRSASGRARDDRGDVPGWVMVTVMTATVVAALMTLVEDELRALLVSAFDSVR